MRTARVIECRTRSGPWLKWSYEVWIEEGEKRIALLYIDSLADLQQILHPWNVRVDVIALEESNG